MTLDIKLMIMMMSMSLIYLDQLISDSYLSMEINSQFWAGNIETIKKNIN